MQREAVDFSTRVEPKDLPEWMDEPCSYDDFRQCLLDLHRVNRITLSYRPTLDFLERIVKGKSAQTLRIVDVGCGGGDMLRRVDHWARLEQVSVKLVGIDLNPYARQAALEFGPKSNEIEWITGNAYSYQEPVDVVISSLFTHHLSELEAIEFLRWSECIAQSGWFVNDLVREEIPYKLFGVLAGAMRWHRFVQHDGPVSFRRSFREADWERMATAAGLAREVVQMKRWTPGRLCVGRVKRASGHG